MAIGRISGQMLKSNLSRSGTDLTFETNLLALDVTNSRVGVGTASPAVKLHVSSTDAIRVPSGTTAQRPGSPANGDIRYNSTTSQIEGYSNGQFRSMVGSGLGNIVEDTTPQLGGDLDINGNAIVSTSDGNIALTPNGTGEVDISKVDIDSGAIDGTAIGANSASTGAFTTLNTSGNTVLGDASGDSLTLNGGSLVLGNNVTVTGTFANLGAVTTVDINGGTVDGAVIGGASAGAGTFTTLTATTGVNLDDGGDGAIDGCVIGGNTPAAGTFTTLAVNSNATISGNLTVNGTTTTIDSATLTIEDPMIQLAKNNSGGAANTFDQGIFFNRGSDANVVFIWDESADEFVAAVTSGEDGTTSGNVTIDSYAGMQVGVAKASEVRTGTIKAADGTASSTIANSTGVHTIASAVLTTADINAGTIDAVTIGGATPGAGSFTTINSSGNVVFGDATGDSVTITGNSIVLSNTPTVTGTFADLGTVTTVDINGGTIDGAAIGGASASTGAFTTIDASQGIDITADSQALRIGAGNDLSISHDGTNTGITNATGNLTITTAASSSVVINEGSADVDFRVESNGNTHAIFVDAGNDRVGIATSSPSFVLDASGSTDAIKLPSGTTAQRPTAAAGIIRYNSQTSKYEACNDGSTYVELAIAGDTPSISKVSTTGDGSTTTFSGFFSSAPETVNNVLVFIDNVFQEPTENYTVSSTNITFTSAPHSGARIFAMTGFDNTALASSGIARTQTSSVSFESSATNIMTFNGASYRSAELMITLNDANNTEYATMKAMVVHNGTTAFGNVYSIVNTGSTDLGTITFNYNSGTVEVKAVSTGGAQTALVQYSLQAV